MCEMIVKQLYIFPWEGTSVQFSTKLCDFLWNICPAKDEPLQNDVILFPYCS